MIKHRSLGTEEYHVCDLCGGEVSISYGQVTQGWANTDNGGIHHIICGMCLNDVCLKALKLPPQKPELCCQCGKNLPRTYYGNICEKCVKEMKPVKNHTDYQMIKIYDKM